MIDTINRALHPLDIFLKRHLWIIRWLFLWLSIASVSFLFVRGGVKESGEKALFVLWILLWMPVFARVFSIELVRTLLPLRKEIGILMWTLALVHALGSWKEDPTAISQSYFWWQNGMISFYAVGLFAFLLTLPLYLTSNEWAIKKLWKKWKTLHKLAYIIIILVVVHVVLLKVTLHLEITPLVLLILYFIAKILEWRGISLGRRSIIYKKWQRWICPPCGFVYDPETGDLDSGIEPGTEFSDIPDDWSCPQCGVKKSDFVPYDETNTEEHTIEAEIVEKTYLNPTVIELVIRTRKVLESKIGQFVSFLWRDGAWTFIRSYSIADQDGKETTFLIKLTPNGRGAKMLEKLTIWDSIELRGVYGNFLLEHTKHPKIFIATGTGLAPIYSMLLSLPRGVKKSLHFCVAKKDDLFYVDKLRAIPELDLYIYVSSEEVTGTIYGRIDVGVIDATEETEWYLCGNPVMVSESVDKLKSRWLTKIYTEEFGLWGK